MKKKLIKQPDDSRRLTYGEAATMLKVSVRTVRRYAADGLLDKICVTDRNVFVTEASVRSCLAGRPLKD